MKKFNVKQIEKELLEINKVSNIKSKAAIQVVINNLHIYNQLLDEFVEQGKHNNLYILYQMSSTIFKQLKEYKILPSSTDDSNVVDEDEFISLVNQLKPQAKQPIGFTANNKKDIETR